MTTNVNLKSLLILITALAYSVNAANTFVPPVERTTGLGCIPEGETVSYECTVTDTTDGGDLGSTVWLGSAFNCTPNNQISLLHSQFQPGANMTCGDLLMVEALNVNGNEYTSRLTIIATPSTLYDRMINCTLSTTVLVGSDTLKVGVHPPAPGPLSVLFKPPETPLTISWSPPSSGTDVDRYNFTVTGMECGCVNTSFGADTTNVTCNGWIANNQTCSFKVQAISKDCGLTSDPATSNITLVAEYCDPQQLGSNPTSNFSGGFVTVKNGIVVYTGVSPQSTASLTCDNGFQPGEGSVRQQCMINGIWSGRPQSCVPQSLGWVAAVVFGTIALLITVTVVSLAAGYCCHRWHKKESTRNDDHQHTEIEIGNRHSGVSDDSDTLLLQQSTAPDKMSRPIDPVTQDNVAYFRPFQAEGRIIKIQKCVIPPSTQTNSEEVVSPIWSRLELCPANDTSLAIINNSLYTVGGEIVDSKRYTDKMYYFDESSQCWVDATTDRFPAMKIRRKQATVVLHGNHLIVAGGREENGPTKAVEVLDLTKKEWKKAKDLPRKMFRASGCICSGYLFLLGGFDIERTVRIPINASYKVRLSDLIDSCDNTATRSVFKQIANPRLYNSAFACVSGRIFAIGGTEKGDKVLSSGAIYEYRDTSNSCKHKGKWIKRDKKLSCTRAHPFAVVFESMPNTVMVVGGNTPKQDSHALQTFEFIEL